MKNKIIKISIIIILIVISIVPFKFKENKQDNNIETNIEESRQYVISATYPKTNIKKLDNEVENFVLSQIKLFKNKSKGIKYLIDRDELNIDYDYYTVNNRYINITIKLYIYHSLESIEEYYVQTYYFDKISNRFYNVLDIFSNENDLLVKVNNMLISNNKSMINNLGELTYSFDNDYLIIYLIENNITTYKIPLNSIKLNIEIINNDKEKDIEPVIKNDKIIDPKLPVVALTFDDGPSRYTKDIIDTLKSNNVNATFFVLGNKIEIYKDIIRESIKNGNEIGNHSYNHKWLSKLSTNELLDQINKTQDILKETVNYTPTCFRPTYGSVNNKIRKSINLSITLWTIDTKDWKINSVDRIVERAIKDIEDGDIILMHDIFQRSSEALKKIIPKLKEQGYQFVTISELEEVKLLRTKY
ncbi:MAG: polysaccharide deacetylase family protein [Tenericutes bacterium]|nr:polysaccharide deacetylase family protein [Mycoplasmatota bacterium]